MQGGTAVSAPNSSVDITTIAVLIIDTLNPTKLLTIQPERARAQFHSWGYLNTSFCHEAKQSNPKFHQKSPSKIAKSKAVPSYTESKKQNRRIPPAPPRSPKNPGREANRPFVVVNWLKQSALLILGIGVRHLSSCRIFNHPHLLLLASFEMEWVSLISGKHTWQYAPPVDGGSGT
jgi:hypothetical protein